ncbi:hypothetical protein JW906_01655 [bacterium]|nr:hypothetical protein [bacterium]
MALCVLFATGCARFSTVPYMEVEKTNRVRIVQVSGGTVEGTVVRAEPHQITLSDRGRNLAPIPRKNIQSITRKPPVYDDFRKGISEEEIASAQSKRNALIYGFGGGAMSLGAGFFAGSMLSQSLTENGGTVLAGTTLGSGIVGTILFVRAGKAKDRREAVEIIREARSIRRSGEDSEPGIRQDGGESLDAEKRRSEELRKQREELLRQLEETRKNP